MARKKNPTLRDRFDAWGNRHNALMCTLVFLVVAMSLFGIFLFVTFTDFSGSAEFIYNQF